MSIAKLLLRLATATTELPSVTFSGTSSPRTAPLRRWRRSSESLEERLALSTVTMTANEQLLIELINRARANPTAEMATYAQMGLNDGLAANTISPSPKEPLAPDQTLTVVAGNHSQDMINRDFFAHTNPDGLTPTNRANAAGFPGSVGENIAQAGTTLQLNQVQEVYDRHIALLRSAGHRTNIMSENTSEVGTGIRYGVFTTGGVNYNSILVTENFADRGVNYITGVAYSDAIVDDDFYTVGEGAGGILVTATNVSSGQTYSVTTGSSGGYALAVPNGVYDVIGVGGNINGQVLHNSVLVSSQNVKVDIVTTEGVTATPPQTNGMGVVGLIDGQWWQAASTGAAFSNELWGTWSTQVPWEFVSMGDFDGDGDQDIAGRSNGRWWVASSDGSSFTSDAWGNWSTKVSWSNVMVGDFNGDGRDDLVGRIQSGTWWVSLSNGSSFTNESWGNWSPRIDWQNIQVGDFNGDQLDDLVGRASDGSWWVAESTGSGFTSSRWGGWSSRVDWSGIQVGDFNGDGRDELIGRTGRAWWVAESTGSGFVNRVWTIWSDNVEWTDIRIGDVDGDGRDDLLGRTSGQWWVARTQGTQIVNERWAVWNGSIPWEDVKLCDVDRDGVDDLLARNGTDWWVGLSDGTRFDSSRWGRWPSTAAADTVFVGYFG